MKLIDRLQQLDHEYQQLRRQLAMGLIEGIVLTPVKKKKILLTKNDEKRPLPRVDDE